MIPIRNTFFNTCSVISFHSSLPTFILYAYKVARKKIDLISPANFLFFLYANGIRIGSGHFKRGKAYSDFILVFHFRSPRERKWELFISVNSGMNITLDLF